MKINAMSPVYAAQRYRYIENRTASRGIEKQREDHADISGEAVSFAKLLGAAKLELQKPENKSDVINQIRDEITSGAYTVDPKKIADSILKFV